MAALPKPGAPVLVEWPEKSGPADTGIWPARVIEVDEAGGRVRCHYHGTGGVEDVQWVPAALLKTTDPTGYAGLGPAMNAPRGGSARVETGPPSGQPRVWVGEGGAALRVGGVLGSLPLGAGDDAQATLLTSMCKAVKFANAPRGIPVTRRGPAGKQAVNARMRCTHGMNYVNAKGLHQASCLPFTDAWRGSPALAGRSTLGLAAVNCAAVN